MTDEIVAAAEILQGAVDDRAQAAIDRAQEHAAQAQATAQAMTDAALQTEMGRQIEGLRQENATWRTSLENQMAGLQSGIAEIRSRLEAPPTAVVVQPSLTLEASGEPRPSPPQPELTDPASVGAGDQGEAGESDQPKPRTAKRRIM